MSGDTFNPPLPMCFTGAPITYKWDDGEVSTLEVYTLRDMLEFAAKSTETALAAHAAEQVAQETVAWLVVHGDSNYSSTRVTFDAESAEAERKEGAEVTPLVAQRARELQEAK